MKKYFVLLMALIMLISTFMGSFAQASLFRSEPKKVEEVICALVGAVAAGVVVHNIVGKDPVTFIASFVGGAIGNDYCKNYVNNAEYQAIKDLMKDGLGPKHGPRILKKENAQFVAAFTISNYGSRSSRNDSGAISSCVEFEASVWKKVNSNSANDRFMGRTGRYWACQNEAGGYEVVRGSSGITIDSSPAVSSTSHSSGSNGGSSGISSGAAARWPRLDFSQIAVGYRVKDAGTGRPRPIYVRTRFGETGFFAGTGATRSGALGVKVAIDTADMNPEMNFGTIENENDVAIECDVLPYCQSFQVRNLNFSGLNLNGRAQYIFKNGDMVVVDPENGRFVIPRNLLF